VLESLWEPFMAGRPGAREILQGHLLQPAAGSRDPSCPCARGIGLEICHCPLGRAKSALCLPRALSWWAGEGICLECGPQRPVVRPAQQLDTWHHSSQHGTGHWGVLPGSGRPPLA
jgi:hypothetical protein